MNDYITFLDNLNRTILGQIVSMDGTTVSIKNPAIIDVYSVDNGNGGTKFNVNMVPVIFREMLNNVNDDIIIDYKLSNIAFTRVTLNSNLIQSYNGLFVKVDPSAANKNN